jgi:periplasmic copper chaperone A
MRSFAVLAVAVLATISALPVHAHDYKLGNLLIDHPWSRPTPQGAPVGSGYLVIRNKGKSADRLVSASASVAGKVEIHQMTVKDGVMAMRPVEGGIAVAPGKTVELKPSGLHLMFMDLKQQLKEGESIPVTLLFEKAGKIDVEFKVEPMGTTSAPKHGH